MERALALGLEYTAGNVPRRLRSARMAHASQRGFQKPALLVVAAGFPLTFRVESWLQLTEGFGG